MCRRVLRALSDRVGTAGLDNLEDMASLRRELDTLTADAITTLRAKHGISWAEVAVYLGMNHKQAAAQWHERHKREDKG